MEDSTDTAKLALLTKWGDCIDAGWLALPSSLLVRQDELQLSCTELVILQNLLLSWWEKEKNPFTRSATIAKRMGVHQRSVQRGLSSLAKKGFVHRVVESPHKTTKGARPRGDRAELWTSYDVKPTVEKLNALKGVTYGRKKMAVSAGLGESTENIAVM
jgi:DNA-binding transcriptional regulator YhcF (GntR family)